MNARCFIRLAAVPLTMLLLAASVPFASAQDAYPSRPIRLIIGFAAGGGNDLLGRIVGQKLSDRLGQPVVVENRVGAGAIIATEYVKNSPADGYTLMIGANGAMGVQPAINPNLSYSSVKDFEPIGLIATFPLVVVVKPTTPIRSIAELIAFTKANPGKANYSGASQAFQLAVELFKLKTGAPLQFVPYRSTGESATAVLSDVVLTTFADAGPVAGQIKSGQLRALAVTSAKRDPEFPDVPTIAEAGVPGLEIDFWTGLYAPHGTPPAIVKKLQGELVEVLKAPDVRERFRTLAVIPGERIGADLHRFMEAEIARYTEVARLANVKAQ